MNLSSSRERSLFRRTLSLSGTVSWVRFPRVFWMVRVTSDLPGYFWMVSRM